MILKRLFGGLSLSPLPSLLSLSKWKCDIFHFNISPTVAAPVLQPLTHATHNTPHIKHTIHITPINMHTQYSLHAQTHLYTHTIHTRTNYTHPQHNNIHVYNIYGRGSLDSPFVLVLAAPCFATTHMSTLYQFGKGYS